MLEFLEPCMWFKAQMRKSVSMRWYIWFQNIIVGLIEKSKPMTERPRIVALLIFAHFFSKK
eukprot:UN04726